MQREIMEFDVLIVGAGPAGLSAGIRLMQLSAASNAGTRICILEKGSEVGAHILSGAVLDPRSLNELLPDWEERGAPLNTPVEDDRLWWMTKKRAVPLPVPGQMNNHGNYIISLGKLCRWLGKQAEDLGVEIYPGFAGAEILFDQDGAVCGVATGAMGVGRDGTPAANYQPGVELRAKQVLIAEGCRGSLTKKLTEHFSLRDDAGPQTYGLGLKELWEVRPELHHPGRVVHTLGWPLDRHTYGGSFIYHLDNQQVAIGLVVGLDYENPYFNPYEEFQRLKTHEAIRPLFEGGRRISYGARTLSEGGFQSIPKLAFPGGVLIGDAAGFLDMPRLKGIDNAMKSGMIAAETAFSALSSDGHGEAFDYTAGIKESRIWKELFRVRNIRPSFHRGLWGGLAWSALETWIFRGRLPWTLSHREDHRCLKKAAECNRIEYPKPDGTVTFDILSSVFISNTSHDEDQPVHLQLEDPDVPVRVNLADYDAPEQRYCPAGVYEIVTGEGGHQQLQINAQNCLHCKACDIKDPGQNIRWTVPEGGGGPNYTGM